MMRNAMRLRECSSRGSRSKTTGLQLLSHNPVSHPSSLGTVKCDVYQAEATGFEPAISALTGLHVRPLHHASSVPQNTNSAFRLSMKRSESEVGSRESERPSPGARCP